MMSVRTDLLLAVLRDTLAATVNFIMLSTANQEVYDPAELHLGDSALVVDRAAHQIFQANLLAHPGTAKLDIVTTVVGEEHPYLPDDIRDGQLPASQLLGRALRITRLDLYSLLGRKCHTPRPIRL